MQDVARLTFLGSKVSHQQLEMPPRVTKDLSGSLILKVRAIMTLRTNRLGYMWSLR